MKLKRVADQFKTDQIAAGSAAEMAQALGGVSTADMLRLKAIARLRSRGLPGDIGWSDLLNEAVARALDGSRQRPDGIGMVVFLAGVMRSIADEHWRRLRREAGLFTILCDETAADTIDPGPDAERIVAETEALASLDCLFADDLAASQILAGLAGGVSAGEIRESYGLSEIDYDSTRKRMRRLLLKRGLTWRFP